MQERRQSECHTNQRNHVPILAVLTLPTRSIVKSMKDWRTNGMTSTKETQLTRNDMEGRGKRLEPDM